MKLSTVYVLALASFVAAAPEQRTIEQFKKQAEAVDKAFETNVVPRLKDIQEAIDIGEKWLKYSSDKEGDFSRVAANVTHDVTRLWEISKSQDPTWDPEVNDKNSHPGISYLKPTDVLGRDHENDQFNYINVQRLAKSLYGKYGRGWKQYIELSAELEKVAIRFDEMGGYDLYKGYKGEAVDKGCEVKVWMLARMLMGSLAMAPAVADIMGRIGMNIPGSTRKPMYNTNIQWDGWYRDQLKATHPKYNNSTVWDCANTVQEGDICKAVDSTFANADLQLFDTLLGSGVHFEGRLAKNNETAKLALMVRSANPQLVTEMEWYWMDTIAAGARPPIREFQHGRAVPARNKVPVAGIEKLFAKVKNANFKVTEAISDMIKLVFDTVPPGSLTAKSSWKDLQRLFLDPDKLTTNLKNAYRIRLKEHGTMGKKQVGGNFAKRIPASPTPPESLPTAANLKKPKPGFMKKGFGRLFN